MKQHEISQIFCVNRGMARLRNCWTLSGLQGELVYVGHGLLCLSCSLFLSHLWFLVHNPFLSSGCLSTSSLPTTSLLNLISVFLHAARVWPSTCCCLYPCAAFYCLASTAPQTNVPFKPHETSLPPQNLS